MLPKHISINGYTIYTSINGYTRHVNYRMRLYTVNKVCDLRGKINKITSWRDDML